MPRVVVVVQARMTSTRLPGKVLADLDGRPMLARQLERLALCRRVDAVVIATTSNATDEPLVALAGECGALCFRGSEDDVLSRYVGAARASAADVVVRVTSDCPLIDAGVVDRVIARLIDETAGERGDYASNTRVRTYPRGLDVEALFADVLYRIDRLAASRPAREHVTWFLHREHPELFHCADVVDERDSSDLRWTVDAPDDLSMVRALWAAAGGGAVTRPYRELLAIARSRPDITGINAAIAQKEA